MKSNWLDLVTNKDINNIVIKYWSKHGIKNSELKSIATIKDDDDLHIVITHADDRGRLGKSIYTEYGPDSTDIENITAWAKLFTSALPDTLTERYLDDYRKHTLEKIVAEKNNKMEQIGIAYDFEIEKLEKQKKAEQQKIIKEISEVYQDTVNIFSNISRSCKRHSSTKEEME
ncbi:MAG: hypothetical protein E7361_02155 [Clostridiales bacterium]|nr:hypothetical protein [Clostridiales bacterium]